MTKAHTDPFYINIAKTIEDCGRQIIAVGAENKALAFAYTIGNATKGLPELLLIGNCDPKIAQSVLNKLSDQLLKANKPFVNGERVSIGGKFDLQVWDTTAIAHSQYTLQATEFFHSREYAVQQVVVPDPKGCYPTDKRCHKRYRVPVLRPTVDLMRDMRSTLVH
jgi:hypothetical protein